MIGIVGGDGFVGKRLAIALSKSNHAYKVLDKNLSGDNYIDITDPSTFHTLAGVSILINLAAEHQDNVSPMSRYHDVNVQGSKNLCDFADGADIQKIIFTSSVAVYGFTKEPTDETGPIAYFNEYGKTKYFAEQIYKNWFEQKSNHRSLVIIRPTVVFGESNRGNVYNLLKQIHTRKFIMIGDGENRKSMAYVDNVADALVHAIDLDGYHLYNYADLPDFNMNELVATSRKALFGKYNVGLRLPSWLGLLIGYSCDALSAVLGRKLTVSSVRVRKFMENTRFVTSIHSTGFTPRFTLKEALQKTLKFEFDETRGGGTNVNID